MNLNFLLIKPIMRLTLLIVLSMCSSNFRFDLNNTCEKLEEVRQPFISKLETLITFQHGSHWWNQLGDRDMVQLILDNTKLKEINEPTRLQIWDISRGLCYVLHSKRSAILNEL